MYQCFCEKYGNVFDSIDNQAFCYDFERSKLWITMFSNGITLIIAVVNVILRSINMTLIKKIGFNYESQLLREIMQSIVYVSYFTTALLLVLCNANFEHYPFLRIVPLRGQFADTTTNWYFLIAPAI